MRVVVITGGSDGVGAVSSLAGLVGVPVEAYARRREVVMTVKGKLGRILKLFVPGLVERMALAALKDDVRPR
jgi:NADP-dependent 3-hydroxy acid dehydrogenase YdfG